MMSELEKKAAKEDLRDAFSRHVGQKKPSNWVLGSGSKLGRGLEHGIYGPASWAAAMPGRAASSSLGSLLLGQKNTNPFSPMRGKRLKEIPGMKGLEEISRAEYKEIKGGLQKGRAYKFRGEGHFRPVYYKRRYSPGGAAGLIRKHPLLAGGGGLLAYYLMKNPQSMAAAQGMIPRPNMSVSPEVHRQWQESNAENPFQRNSWG